MTKHEEFDLVDLDVVHIHSVPATVDEPSTRQRLFDLFDAARYVPGVDVVIWERSCAEAPRALKDWAGDHGLACISKEFDTDAKDCGEVLAVALQGYRSIDVYLLRSRK